MKRNLLFVASPRQIGLTEVALRRMKAEKCQSHTMDTEFYRISNHNMGNLTVELHLLSDPDGIIAHLKRNQVDLLIYDERNGANALDVLSAIKKDVTDLATLWGPDFLFPMRRTVAILEESENATHRAFVMGRDHVKDVLVAPKNLSEILSWISRILAANIKIEKERIGLALNGGGLEGFLFQVGVMCALNKVIENFTAHDFDLFSGVSSGSIVTGLLASGVPIDEVAKAACGKSEVLPQLKSSYMFDLATSDILKRIGTQTLSWSSLSLNKWYLKFLRSIPTGVFKGERIREYFIEVIEHFDGTDDFRTLEKELYIGATNQDTFEHVTFGTEGYKHVPISSAVRASSALPPFFTPYKIDDKLYVDGQITKTCNLELVVNKSCRLIFIVDPMKPYALGYPGSVDKEGGIYALIQTVKALIYTRFQSTLSHLTERYPDVDFIVFQPDEECAALMAGLPMRYKIRTQLIELAYRSTLRKIRERYHVYNVKLQKYDLSLIDLKTIKKMERDGLGI